MRLFFNAFVYNQYFMIFVICFLYNAIKTTIFSARCLCHLESFRASRAETPAGQTNHRLRTLCIKQIQILILTLF